MRNGTARARGWGARLFTTTALTGLAATVIATALPGDTHAAGYAIKEQSGSAQGNSFAGATAGAEDISYMFFNPAALIRHEGNQAAVAASYIIVQAETSDATFVLGGASNEDGGQSVVVPAVYGMWSFSPDLKLGLAVTVPYGLGTEYSETWAGRFYAVESELQTININPVIAYRVNEKLSVAAGFQAQTADVLLSSVVNVGGTVFEVEGDDWAYGFNLGVLYEFTDSTRVGLAYRSEIKHEIDGTAKLSGIGSTGATADLSTPATANLGVYHDINNEWSVMAEVGWTGWSSFEEIRIEMDANIGVGTTVVVDEDWNDVGFYAVGVTWRPNEKLTLRTGVAYDQSPIPDSTRTPRIPGADRTWISLGGRYEVSPRFSVDAGYTHVFVGDGDIDLTSSGAFTATFENAVDILVLQATLTF